MEHFYRLLDSRLGQMILMSILLELGLLSILNRPFSWHRVVGWFLLYYNLTYVIHLAKA